MVEIMKIYNNSLYQEDIKYIANFDFPWDKLLNKTVLITGATGQIGSMFIDVIMFKNKTSELNCTIYALGRSEEKMQDRFSYCYGNRYFVFVKYDVNEQIKINISENIDYIFHLASNTHPLQYSLDPIGTITANVIGLKNLLDYAVEKKCKRFLFASTNEVYGENRGDTEKFKEDYCGYINCNTLRAGYPESKRCGEALCQAYITQKKLDIVIPRITRTYGPTLLPTDTKAISQFLQKGIKKEDIVLKSDGNQFYSFLYILDTIMGVFTVLFYGKTGEAYNIADEYSDIKLKDLAGYIAEISNSKVVYEIPDGIEKAGYSKATKARLDNSKIQELGWTAKETIKTGVSKTLKILEELYKY